MLQELTDEGLALDAANGDREAFGRLLERHYGRILSLGQRLLGSRAEAEDLAQDVCIGLARRIRSFRGEARFTTWLYRVVLNAGRDALRRRASRGAVQQGYAEVDQLRRAGDAARAAEAEWLRAALDGLKEDLRETVTGGWVWLQDAGMVLVSAAAAWAGIRLPPGLLPGISRGAATQKVGLPASKIQQTS